MWNISRLATARRQKNPPNPVSKAIPKELRNNERAEACPSIVGVAVFPLQSFPIPLFALCPLPWQVRFSPKAAWQLAPTHAPTPAHPCSQVTTPPTLPSTVSCEVPVLVARKFTPNPIFNLTTFGAFHRLPPPARPASTGSTDSPSPQSSLPPATCNLPAPTCNGRHRFRGSSAPSPSISFANRRCSGPENLDLAAWTDLKRPSPYRVVLAPSRRISPVLASLSPSPSRPLIHELHRQLTLHHVFFKETEGYPKGC